MALFEDTESDQESKGIDVTLRNHLDAAFQTESMESIINIHQLGDTFPIEVLDDDGNRYKAILVVPIITN